MVKKKTRKSGRKSARRPARRRAKKPARKVGVSRKVKKPERKVRRARKPARKVRTAKKVRKVTRPARTVKPVTPAKTLVGTVSHYYTNIGVCVIELTGSLSQGDTISIEGATTSFSQKVDSMQINRVPVNEAKAGDSIGLKVTSRVREGDRVFRK